MIGNRTLWALTACLSLTGAARGAELSGVLVWSEPSLMSLPVSGVVDQVAVQPGQAVRQGELLLALNPTLFKAQVAEARAEADRLTEDEADARRDLERARELYARTVSSTTELDAARLRHARAKAGLAAAQARLEKARRLLAESELRAPFDALVLERHVQPGQAVSAQCQPPALLTLARADELAVSATLAMEQALGLRAGTAVEIVRGDRVVPGVIRAIRFPPGAGAVLEATLARSAGLAPGQAVLLRLPP